MADELIDAVSTADKEADVHSIVLTGRGKAFAAGAAIKEIQQRGFSSNVFARLVGRLEGIYGYTQAYHRGTSRLRLGGGCALAVSGDMIPAADDAKFGQAELKLGVPRNWGNISRALS